MAVKNFRINQIMRLALIAIICMVASGWFRRIIFENVDIGIVFLLYTASLLVFLKDGRKIKYFLIFMFVALIYFQFTTTDIKNTYSFTPAEIDRQISRMNYYPPPQARLGYILENKKEVRIVDRFINNFIKSVDYKSYFPDYFSYIFLPLSYIGLFTLTVNSFGTKGNSRKIFYAFLFTILIISFLGVNGKYGPFIVFPFIVLFIYIAIVKLFRLKYI